MINSLTSIYYNSSQKIVVKSNTFNNIYQKSLKNDWRIMKYIPYISYLNYTKSKTGDFH